MKTRLTAVAMLLGFVVSVCAAVEGKPEQTVKKQAEQAAMATVKGDFKKLADLTHPGVVKKLGGKNKMVSMLESEFKKMKEKGFEFRSARVGNPGPLVPAGSELYTVVPMTLEMKVPKGKFILKGYLLGVSSDKGKTWTFVDGAGIGQDEKKAKELLPNLPDAIKLPKKENPVFEKDE